jgi:hypothetical protein
LGVPIEITTRSRDFENKERDWKSKCVRWIYVLLRVIEVAFYYYFTPLTVIFLTYPAGGSDKKNASAEIKG